MPDADTLSADARGRSWPVFAWGVFLACSWTWCIGMFLPVLLLRDYGILGYVAFFVPNVVGAAAMGWMFQSGEESRDIVRRHLTACRAFSIVTAAFQVYFAAWLLSTAARGMLIPLVAVIVMTYGLLLAGRGSLRAPVVLWGVSAAAFVALLVTGDLRLPANWAGELGQMDVLFLAPVTVFGFLLCPYLDLTFHSAVQGAGRARRAAFTLGFLGLFSVMILFTLFYAPLLRTRPELGVVTGAPWVIGIIFAHICAQLVYTFALHHSMLVDSVRQSKGGTTAGPLLAQALLVLLAAAAGLLAPHLPRLFDLSAGEIGYRLFMAFYGLVFPAYVWICMIPARRAAPGPTRPKVLLWAFTIGVAAPAFTLGFVLRQTWGLALGMAIVLLARLLLGAVTAAGAPARRSA